MKCIQQITDLSFDSRILNIGTGLSISLQQISDLLRAKLGVKFEIIWGERRIGDISQTRLSVDKMNRELQIRSEDPVQRLEKLINVLNLSNHLGN